MPSLERPFQTHPQSAGAAMQIAVLLPLNAKTQGSEVTLAKVASLAQSIETDPTVKKRYQVYFGVDTNDEGLHAEETRRAIEGALGNAVGAEWLSLEPTFPFAACVAWKRLCSTALKDEGNDLFVFLGDDISFTDNTWYQQLLAGFKDIHTATGENMGFGVVALKEHTSPSWPTFPVVHRNHFKFFREIFPGTTRQSEAAAGVSFYNQDADPFLFELYRRFGASRFTHTIVVRNEIGGVRGGLMSGCAMRYPPIHMDWRARLLPEWRETIQARTQAKRVITIDVAIPSFRIEQGTWKRIMDLKCRSADVRFVLVVDRAVADLPDEAIACLRRVELERSDVRIRVNDANRGAPFSRTRALKDAHSDYVVFLDDDVLPYPDLLEAYSRYTVENPSSNGFIGVTKVPVDKRLATNAVHLSQALFFWTIADWAARESKPCPWGVTANVCVKWQPGLHFDEAYPKVGGGEDIDFCIRVGGAEGCLLPAPLAKVHHPWWGGGRRWPVWTRIARWAMGDGLLVDKHPQFTYFAPPNVVEAGFCATLIFVASMIAGGAWSGTFFARLLVSMLVGDIVAGTLWGFWSETRELNVKGLFRLAVALEANFPRMMSEFGHLYGHLSRGRVVNLCRRFEWFLGYHPGAYRYEIARALFQCSLWLLASMTWWWVHE